MNEVFPEWITHIPIENPLHQVLLNGENTAMSYQLDRSFNAHIVASIKELRNENFMLKEKYNDLYQKYIEIMEKLNLS
jgi:hypothetical protein